MDFTTPRLSAERLRREHLDDILRMDQDERIMKTLGGVRTRKRSREYLRQNLAHWDRHGFGLWMLRLREDDSFVGRAYLRHVRVAPTEEIGLGYALLPEYWGMGLATEIASAIVDLAFSRLGFESIIVGSLPDNQASRRVIEKIGGRLERETIYKGLPHVFYRIEADQQSTSNRA